MATILFGSGVGAGPLSPRLSSLGLFDDLAALTPSGRLVGYDVNVSFWSDGASKQRWVALPRGEKIGFSPDGEWRFPKGTVFVKQFDLPGTASAGPRRLETRVLVYDGDGEVHGASYRWRADGTDADLVPEPLRTSVGDGRTWYFPGTADCVTCHTKVTGGVLGVTTRQLNLPLADGVNQLVAWNRAGRFEGGLGKLDVATLPRLALADDDSRTVEDRARSYLDVNCAQCHRPGGVAGNFDARYSTPLGRQNVIDGPVLIDLGIDRARVIAPRDPWRSLALNRVESSEQPRMPPLAHERLDEQGAALLRRWIASLPGPNVLEPPTIEPKGGEFAKPVRVTLTHPQPGVTIRYTLDGSLPGKNASAYEGPFEIKSPATLRVRAYKDGWTRSVVVQETFVVGDN